MPGRDSQCAGSRFKGNAIIGLKKKKKKILKNSIKKFLIRHRGPLNHALSTWVGLNAAHLNCFRPITLSRGIAKVFVNYLNRTSQNTIFAPKSLKKNAMALKGLPGTVGRHLFSTDHLWTL